MKTLTILFSVLLMTSGAAFAQSAGAGISSGRANGADVTGFSSKTRPGLTLKQANTPPNPNVVLKPKLGGVVVDGIKYGTVMISPTAPASYGIGESYLSAPSSRYDLQGESGPAAHRDAGGIKLFSLEF
jgi:hypothetical protein